MKHNTCKFGIKCWVIADSESGYCWNYDIYVGKNGTEIDKTFGLSGQAVIDLSSELQNMVYTIYTDNFYTSPKLAHYLSTVGTYLCGTIRLNRKGFPTELVKTPGQIRRLERGYSDTMQCGSLVASLWKDNKMVYFLSTRHVPELEVATTRKNKDDTVAELHTCR